MEYLISYVKFGVNYFFNFFNVYLFLRERERESTSGGGTERGGQRIQSELCADSNEPDVGLKLMNCETMTQAKVRHSTD